MMKISLKLCFLYFISFFLLFTFVRRYCQNYSFESIKGTEKLPGDREKSAISADSNRTYEIFKKNVWNEERSRVMRIMNLELLPDNYSEDKISNSEAKTLFFKTLAQPLQSVCRTLKRLGGDWFVGAPWEYQQVDGAKFVCLDHLLPGDCLVYSFGLAADWTFEDQMAKLGCSVFAYDHTINPPVFRGENIKFFKTGLGIGPNLRTLKQILEENHHLDSNIDYLKIDIEAAEFSQGGFQDWISSGALINVSQLAIELHIYDEDDNRQFIKLLKILQDLYKLKFRAISHEANMVAGPGSDGFYKMIEVVFMK